MSTSDFEILQRKAEILKAIAHPVRLAILKGLLENGPTNVNNLETGTDISTATVSQHLAKIRNVGILRRKRKGVKVYYSLVDKDNVKDLLKDFLS